MGRMYKLSVYYALCVPLFYTCLQCVPPSYSLVAQLPAGSLFRHPKESILMASMGRGSYYIEAVKKTGMQATISHNFYNLRRLRSGTKFGHRTFICHALGSLCLWNFFPGPRETIWTAPLRLIGTSLDKLRSQESEYTETSWHLMLRKHRFSL